MKLLIYIKKIVKYLIKIFISKKIKDDMPVGQKYWSEQNKSYPEELYYFQKIQIYFYQISGQLTLKKVKDIKFGI